MIIFKIINQKVIQVAFGGKASQIPLGQLAQMSTYLAGIVENQLAKNGASLSQISLNYQSCRSLTKSQTKSQRLTQTNQQKRQLIPIAKSIYFRQSPVQDIKNSNNNKLSSLNKLSEQPMSGAASFYSASYAQKLTPNQEWFINAHPLESLVIEQQNEEEVQPISKYNKHQTFEEAIATPTSQRKLVVLMSWLEAKEKHIDKYRHFYLERGFDVINVKTSPWDILLPNHCAKQISEDCVKFLIEKQYKDVLYHGFSVGGFMFGQVMLHIQRQEPEIRNKLINSIRGMVMDSLVTFEDAPKGIANSIIDNKYGAKGLEYLIKLYLIVAHSIATKYFKEVSKLVWSGPLNCPSLFFISKDDRIVDYRSLEKLADTWKGLGIETHKMVVDDSPHVQIFRNHYDDYVSRVESFLKRIKML